ncbi:hypothetical protein ACFL5M_00870 [Candidatus Neomarinimicrobiota bacterium]
MIGTRPPARISWPDGKDFAFTIFDDTDQATLENVPPVYDLLRDLGLRTTKSIRPISGSGKPQYPGLTAGNDNYLRWILKLQAAGFEIGYHGATFHSAQRPEIIRALKKFHDLFGHDPRTMSNHAESSENLYWGDQRLSGIQRLVYNLLTRFKTRNKFRGHLENDTYFWGDLCREKITYVRNFVFSEINTLKACPHMPYHDPKRPFANYWFASSNGNRSTHFNHLLSERNQDQLEEEGGACIVYTHLACGFFENGTLNQPFKALMTRLSRKNGWFVPVATLLDYLLDQKSQSHLTDAQRRQLEWKWLRQKIVVGTS